MKALALVEHVDRELDLVVLLRRLLNERGVELEIANFYADAPLLLDGDAPRLVLVPFVYAAEDPVLQDYVRAWPETRFINLAWEQIFYPAHAKTKAPRDAFARTRAVHMAWTESFADFLRANGVRPDQIRLVGHAAYGLYEAPYRNYMIPRAELARRHGLDPTKRWVFVPENYRWAFFTDHKLRHLSRHGVRREDLFEMRDYCRRALLALGAWCNALIDEGSTTVIFRPRPATGREELEAFFRAHAIDVRFPVIKAETARDWTAASDVVASSYSTVMIEAALAGKRVVRVDPEPIPAGLRYDWCDLVEAVRDPPQFVSACLGADVRFSGAALEGWARQSFFPAGDPLAALANAVTAEVGLAHVNSAAPRTRAKRLNASLRAAAANLDAEGRDALFRQELRGYFFNRGTHEKDLFDAGDVAARAARWSAILGG